MSINGKGSKEVGTNSFDKDPLFTLQFYSINLSLPRTDICGNKQAIANKEETENTSTGRVDKLKTGRIDIEKDSGTGKADTEKNPGTGGCKRPT